VTPPMARAQAELPELKRFTFFVSRRFEEGRERFRLHMGYFTTLPEAEEWLGVVRDIYPGAWAGEAPGKKLRARAAAAAAAQAQHAQGPLPRSALPNLPPITAPVAHAAPTARPAPPAPVRSAQAPVPVAKAVPTRAAPTPAAKAPPPIVVPAARAPSVAVHPAPAAKPTPAPAPTAVQAMAGIKTPARADTAPARLPSKETFTP